MIISKSVLIKMNGKHISKYRNRGYICNVGDTIEVKVDDIPPSSQVKVEVKCDVCGCIKISTYKIYYDSISNGGYYSCIKCRKDKTINTNLIRYGVEHALQSSEIQKKWTESNIKKYGSKYYTQSKIVKDKIKKSNVEKYGVENVFQSEEIKSKIKETNIEKYGVEYCSQSEEIKSKIKETNIERYGHESHLQNEKIKNKIKETNIEKYGVENVFQSEEIKSKIKKTNIDKYGFEYANQSLEVRIKMKKTSLEKYGVENPSKFEDIKNKIKLQRVERGSWLSDELREPFEIYENEVYNKTLSLKDILYENWDGYDYYDGEYIRDNMILLHTDPKYPTIDHKISTYHGFNNGLSTDTISNINNLCITKRSINSSKNRLTEEQFYEKMNNQ